jgi:hypothetical protein
VSRFAAFDELSAMADMNDPHVETLYYRINHAKSVDFNKAPALEHAESGFIVRIERDQATITMKDHYDTAESARAAVEPFLRAWELSCALYSATDKFEFSFQKSATIDRVPSPGILDAAIGVYVITGQDISTTCNVSRSRYPEPPIGLACDAYVDFMLHRYRMYREGRTTLADVSNYCLTVLELAAAEAGAEHDARKVTAQRFGFALNVLGTLGRLSSTKGGIEARKGKASRVEFTAEERVWLEAALQRIIRRAAEVAYDPRAAEIEITMANLPPI